MSENLSNNPFAGLFTNSNDVVCYERNSPAPNTSLESGESLDYKLNEDKLLQDVFGILRSDSYPNNSKRLFPVDSDTADGAIFLRISATNVEQELVPQADDGITTDRLTVESQVIPYLFGCFCKLQRYKNDGILKDVAHDLQKILIRYLQLVLEDNSCVDNQPVYQQYVTLFKDTNALAQVSDFTKELATMVVEEYADFTSTETLMAAFKPMMDIICAEMKQAKLLVFQQYWFNFLQVLAAIEPLAEILICYSTPKQQYGIYYAETILGAPLAMSCLPKHIGGLYEFFDPPLAQPKTVEGNIWSAVEYITESMYKVFHSLLKCSTPVRNLTLQWLGACISVNSERATLSHGSHFSLDQPRSATDGFMLNLGHVLLRLCQPFCTKTHEKVPKIDPTYAAAKTNGNGAPIRLNLSEETCLVPTSSGETRPVADSFGFVTECFFFTQRALHLGYNVVIDKFTKANRVLAMAQRMYNDRHSTLNREQQEDLTRQVEAAMIQFLSLKASLTNPDMINHLVRFHATTAFWLMQIMIDDNSDKLGLKAENYYPRELKTIQFPLTDTVPATWKCIPEFVVENTIHFLCLIRRIDKNVFEEHGPNFLDPILTEIIVLMESPRRLFNPHLRAELAEALESFVPSDEDGNAASLGSFHRQQLFIIHPHRLQIIANLLELFVSIEMTGQSVQFEQKFNYRRPMYIVMKYLWKIPEHRNVFKSLAEDAEINIEAVRPPLFLRFINLLINDAVFLIDEALSNMAQLRKLQQDRDAGEWNNLSLTERSQRQGLLEQTENIARFDNILGRKTVSTLRMLTTEIKSIFCHPTMVDRIASMLNYILLQLVGPNNRNFKVKGQQEYEFNPGHLVINISTMYSNLGDNDNFILAVSQDGRSYSTDLFDMAESVLIKIGGFSILDNLRIFSVKVKQAATLKKEEDEILNDAPDEFLDPIMSSLMTDPVILPSSKVSVDRQTIARHLLSDQTDPFNRSPLTMDMIIPNVELRNKIQVWIASKKESNASTSTIA